MLIACLFIPRAIVRQGAIFDVCLVPRPAIFVEEDLIDAFERNV